MFTHFLEKTMPGQPLWVQVVMWVAIIGMVGFYGHFAVLKYRKTMTLLTDATFALLFVLLMLAYCIWQYL